MKKIRLVVRNTLIVVLLTFIVIIPVLDFLNLGPTMYLGSLVVTIAAISIVLNFFTYRKEPTKKSKLVSSPTEMHTRLIEQSPDSWSPCPRCGGQFSLEVSGNGVQLYQCVSCNRKAFERPL